MAPPTLRVPPRRGRVVIVGGGPVACLVALGFRSRGYQVELHEKGPDVRSGPSDKGHSFNLTLTSRGLGSLGQDLQKRLYSRGVQLPQRVVHRADGVLSYQRYGPRAEHHLLTIPRRLLHQLLLTEAENTGAQIFFDHECVAADTRRATATFTDPQRRLHDSQGDLLVGCDGANSVVRQEMSRQGAHMSLTQWYLDHGYIELTMPPARGGGHALLTALRDPGRPESLDHGFHIWPRGDIMLLAQPNVDETYTTTFFLPLEPGADGSRLSFHDVTTSEAVRELFTSVFADVVRFLPDLEEDFLATPPASVKTVKCAPYHYGRAVLVGDSAHTMVPFYGQGINCSFEDVRTFFAIHDHRAAAQGSAAFPEGVLEEYTRTRKPAGDAMADLSLANLEELSSFADEAEYHERSRLEIELHARRPEDFIPLYHMVAFTDIPYQDVVARDARQRAVIDELARSYDLVTQVDEIIEAYLGALDDGASQASVDDRSGGGLVLSADRKREMLHAVSARISRWQRDLDAGAFPASYLHDAVEIGEYEGGKEVAARLREPVVPRSGTDLDDLLTQVFDIAMATGTVHAHRGFLAHVPSGGLFQGALGEFISRTLNRFVGAWAAAPGFTQLEVNVIRWFCEILGYGHGSFGYLTTGGSIANFMALRCALARSSEDGATGTVYVSSEGHFSVIKAAKMAGLPADSVRTVLTRGDWTIDVDCLRAALEEDRSRGAGPVFVVATAGTTNTGAVDDLQGVAELCKEHGAWMHVDACLGGFFRLTERGCQLLAGVERADSVAVDAHKSLFLPHGTSALLVRRREDLPAAFGVPGSAHYMPGTADEDDVVDLCSYGPELSREMRGLSVWLPLKMHGIDAFARCLDEKLDQADHLAEGLRRIAGVEILPRTSPHMPVVAFRGVGGEAQTRRLCELVCSRGNVYLATTRVSGHGLVLRGCVLHHDTDDHTIDRALADVRWAVGHDALRSSR